MNIKSSENINIYGMKNIFNEIINLYNNKKMPNKIIFSGKSGIGKATLAYHVMNYILSLNEEYKYNLEDSIINKNNRSYKLLQNNTHPNIHIIDLIDEKKSIDIAQIRQMITYTNKSSFNNIPRFILIDNIENLNKNSINALLKIVEDPNQNIYFILIHNNEKKILPTLKSRCLSFKINFSFNENIKIINTILKKNVFDLINHDLVSYYNTPGEIINMINFANDKKINLKSSSLKDVLNILIENSYYKKNKNVKNLIINLIELYFLKEYQLTSAKSSLLNTYHNFLNKISNTETFNLDEESLFFEFKSKLL